jgi:hypothetical protein
MLNDGQDLLEEIAGGLKHQATVESVVLFGSRVRAPDAAGSSDVWSDVDLHIVSSDPGSFSERSWLVSLSRRALCMHVNRPASGGVCKTTLLYADGEVDMVVIPRWQMKLARYAVAVGLHRSVQSLNRSMNEMSTIMRGGYRFLKGESAWGGFYAKVVAQFPGQRLNPDEIVTLADLFLLDYLWIRQKVARGELIAAQRMLHHALAETLFRLKHELRLRQGKPTFREARRLEQLLPQDELAGFRLSASLRSSDLLMVAEQALATLLKLITELGATWEIPKEFEKITTKIARYPA